MLRRGHMEGTKHKRTDGRWAWQIMLGGKRRTFYGRTEKEARAKKNRAIRDYEQGVRHGNARLTVGAYLDAWMDQTARQRVRPSTLASYRGHIETHIKPAVGHIRLSELGAGDVNRMLTAIVDSGRSPRTANHVRGTLRTALRSAVRDGMVARNAAQLSDARRETRERVVPLTPDEARRLIADTRDDPMGPLLTMALASGMRQGELLGLQWSDIDADSRTLRIERALTWREGKEGEPTRVWVFGEPKTEQSKRSLRLSRIALEALARQRGVIQGMMVIAAGRWRDHGLVFPSSVGTPLNPSNVTHRCERLMRASGIEGKRFHDLRHSATSFLLAQGMDLFVVKEILGHSQIAQTANTYGHLLDSVADEAAEHMDRALGGDGIFDGKTNQTERKDFGRMTENALPLQEKQSVGKQVDNKTGNF